MSWQEFGLAVEAWDQSERIYWERTRILFKRTLEPHLNKGANVSAKDMIPLPWDGPIRVMSREEIDEDIKRKEEAWRASRRS